MINSEKPSLSGHADPFTIRADPGRPIADPPLILFETVVTDLKTAGTAPAELLFLSAAMALIFTEFPAPVT
jgi:hypothetical protein